MSTKQKWEKEKAAAAAVQIAFDLGVDTQTLIKKKALDEHLNTPDFIRKILGLQYKNKPVRPRLTLSLSDEDFSFLAKEYGVDPNDRLKIKELAAEKLIQYAKKQREI
ncbi:MAG: hypothetical protein MI756_09455 [Chromatiales bacterium]|nr:hypothetical protein [Chromatiales bacterium]